MRVVQRHGGVGAKDRVFGRMVVLRLPLQQRGLFFSAAMRAT